MKKIILIVIITILIATAVIIGINSISKSFKVNTFKSTKEATAKMIDGADSYSFRFNANVPFKAVNIKCSSYSDDIGTITIELYRWDQNFYKTTASTPIASKVFENFPDNSELTLDFKSFSQGEYLCKLKSGGGKVGIWVYDDEYNHEIQLYNNDTVINGNIDASITFTKETEDYFNLLSYTEYESINPDDIKLTDFTPKVDPTTWVATDALGRTLPTSKDTGPPAKNKNVGIFYWPWHYAFSNKEPYNLNDLIEQHPEAANDYNNKVWNDYIDGQAFWNEPIYGYYSTLDRYVIRKHAELLADAGVDVIIIDATNGTYLWTEACQVILEVFYEARKDGVKTPQIAYMLNFGVTSSINKQLLNLYTSFYSQTEYADLWFYFDGKPLIMANKNAINNNTPNSEKIKEFFTFRRPEPSYFVGKKASNESWGWLSVYPQTAYMDKEKNVEQITVGVAQNANRYGLVAMNDYRGGVYGRSHTGRKDYSYSYKNNGKTITITKNTPDSVLYGLNFQEQWDYALSLEPEFVFVTGWNEWVASRFKEWQGSENAFPDQFNNEYSRDIEPTKGILKDNYYYQLVSNIRKYKGVTQSKKANKPKTIDIYGDISAWDSINSYYHYKNNTYTRDSKGYGSHYYKNNTMRNDIVNTKVSYDDGYVYFYVETAEKLTSLNDPAWMRLFIDVGESKVSWEGFEFVVNRLNPEKNGKAYIEASTGGWEWSNKKSVEYSVKNNILQIKIPLSYLGLTKDNVAFNFKWSDNMQTEGDIMDFYVNGDVAPGGRFCFSYTNKQ